MLLTSIRAFFNLCTVTMFIIFVPYNLNVFPQQIDTTTSDSLTSLKEIDTLSNSITSDSSKQFSHSQPTDSINTTVPPGKELLPINIKKTKFAYFDTTQSYNRVIINNAFDIGEKLTFVIRYGPIVAGTATMAIPKVVEVNGYECYHIVTETRSNRFFSAFFKVRDRVESYMDKDGLFSWRFEKQLREGKYRANQYVEFDHINRIAVTNGKDTLRIPPCVQDILTAFYYVRTLPMKVGKSLFIDNQADRKLYPLEIKIHRKERIKVRAGKFDCIVVEPVLRSDAIFKQRGRLTIWLTDDHRRIPIQMSSKVLIGSITAELKKFEGVM